MKQRNIARLFILTLTLVLLWSPNTLPIHSSSQAAQAATDPRRTEPNDQPTSTAVANGKIAFTSDRDGNREIYVMDPDGTNQVRLTNNQVVDDHPTWSPDGTKIAFVSERASGGFAIFVMNADGTNKVEITPIVFDNPDPIFDAWGMSWSPDGNRIVFQEGVADSHPGYHPNDIFIVNIDGRNRQLLVGSPSDERQPAWSPDGSRILFSKSVSVNSSNLFTIRPDGTDLQALPALGHFDRENDLAPTWSPTGDKIAVQVWDYIDFENIAIANADGSNLFWFAGEISDKPDWSPDGSKIVFHLRDGGTQIYVQNVDGTGLTRLTDQPGNNFKPSWQSLVPAACPNPIDCNDFFVRQQYQDFLNREPDAGGLAYWTGQLDQCGANVACVHQRRIGVSAAFFVEMEFQETGYFVYRFYKASFGRQPNYAEFTADRANLIGGPNLEANKQVFADQWVQRAAFTQTFPNTLSNTEFVNKLFDTASLTASTYNPQRQQETDAMNVGRSRALVLRDVIEIPDFKNIPDPNDPRYSQIKQTSQYNPAFVLMQYFGYLHRDLDRSGYDFWLDIVNNREPNNYRGMVCSFITSAEYQLRFGTTVTRSNADCGR
jgi:hypothetical protein